MKQSLVLAIYLTLLVASSSSVHGENKPEGKAPAMSPASAANNSDCSSVVMDMADCLSFISAGSNDTAPTKACCDGMNKVLSFNPKCICTGPEMARQMGIQINNTRAVSMPSLCKVTITPPDCGISNAPKTSPVAPTPSSPPSPPSAETPGKSAVAPASTPTDTTAKSPSPSSGAGTLSVSVLLIVAMSFLSYA